MLNIKRNKNVNKKYKAFEKTRYGKNLKEITTNINPVINSTMGY